MAQSAQLAPNQAWDLYKRIETVVEKRCTQIRTKQGVEQMDIHYATQRLCMAVMSQYKLTAVEHSEFYYNIQIDQRRLPDLSTTEAMLDAEIREWDGAIPASRAENFLGQEDLSGDNGRPAGYYAKPSLRSVLKIDFFELEAMLNATPQQVKERYLAVAKAVGEVYLNLVKNEEQAKAKQITDALSRLQSAVNHSLGLPARTNIDTKQVDSLDLYSYDSMLNTKFNEWQEAIPRFTNISSILGRDEGYYPQLSLAEALVNAEGEEEQGPLEQVKQALAQ